MKRLILHWSAGVYKPNQGELTCYHYLVDDKGVLYHGKYKPEDNLNCLDGGYAAHTGGLNTGSIGVALCGMLGYRSPIAIGDYPLTKTQTEKAFEVCAQLCKKYNIPIDKKCVKTHWEVGLEYPTSSSAGKVDITFLPFQPSLSATEVCDYIRQKIKWYMEKI